jgi:hypothetical protein
LPCSPAFLGRNCLRTPSFEQLARIFGLSCVSTRPLSYRGHLPHFLSYRGHLWPSVSHLVISSVPLSVISSGVERSHFPRGLGVQPGKRVADIYMPPHSIRACDDSPESLRYGFCVAEGPPMNLHFFAF